MKTIKGPAIFLAQFLGDEAPFNSLDTIADYMAALGYKGLQLPTWDPRVIDIKLAAESQTYADELNGKLKDKGLEITELASHIVGQLVASHPVYDDLFDGFAVPEVRNNPKARAAWATDHLKLVAKASKNLGLSVSATFSGALA